MVRLCSQSVSILWHSYLKRRRTLIKHVSFLTNESETGIVILFKIARPRQLHAQCITRFAGGCVEDDRPHDCEISPILSDEILSDARDKRSVVFFFKQRSYNIFFHSVGGCWRWAYTEMRDVYADSANTTRDKRKTIYRYNNDKKYIYINKPRHEHRCRRDVYIYIIIICTSLQHGYYSVATFLFTSVRHRIATRVILLLLFKKKNRYRIMPTACHVLLYLFKSTNDRISHKYPHPP